jgi:2'-5' RNA ligase
MSEETETPEEPGPRPEPPRPLRLFVAVNLQIASVRKLGDAVARLRHAMRNKPAKLAWVAPANLHVTLKFLGWGRPEVASAIGDALVRVASGRRAFDIQTRGVGGFPDLDSASVLWVGVADPSGGLVALAEAVEKEMAVLGFAREKRPYHPHVTVARVKDGWNPELRGALAPLDADFGKSFVKEVVLYESRTKSTGSEYTALARAALTVPERQTRGLEEEGTRSEEPETNGRQST